MKFEKPKSDYEPDIEKRNYHLFEYAYGDYYYVADDTITELSKRYDLSYKKYKLMYSYIDEKGKRREIYYKYEEAK